MFWRRIGLTTIRLHTAYRLLALINSLTPTPTLTLTLTLTLTVTLVA